ncbi:nicotinamide-nucleotide amidohydrolase family protein [Corynebacterium macginleyi]|nr:nicotinamide-nucleotide amidohydrolase family protein [Corynebacterium macginleyi]MBK4140091.1 nicotinamide-nucleotide amidohydrolase family protein [Corynebacterium macginleyi]MBK4143795.1 nicotinamide-nucleotide amidohydrolase family protein [Corynebacterium macginleyi]MBK4166089.1 nicotinamide-nucleotide amidohydrolase family protein [Corynebacterium macginleyi]
MSFSESDLVALLSGRHETVAFCESLTAGLASATIASVPGASAVLRGGLIAYSTEVKSFFLGKPISEIERVGVVSGKTAVDMACAAAAQTGADWGIGLTGVAGPEKQEGKEPGTVFLGIYSLGRIAQSYCLRDLGTERNQIRRATVDAAISQLGEIIKNFSTSGEQTASKERYNLR